MAIKVKAIERNLSFNKDEKNPRFGYVMQAEMYSQLALDKAIEQASLASGLPKAAIQAGVTAYGNMVKTWCTEGHSIPIPGLGIMRFGLRSTAVSDVSKVSAGLITARRVIFIPSVEIKQALADTSVTITCYDRDGKVVKSVTSSDKGNVEDPDGNNPSGGGSDGGGSDGGGTTPGGSGSTSGNDGTGDSSNVGL